MAHFSGKNFKKLPLFLLLLGAVVTGVSFLKFSQPPQAIQSPEKSAAHSSSTRITPNLANHLDSPDLLKTANLCQQLTTAQEARDLLALLNQNLSALPLDQATGLISDFLETGTDASLPLPFKLASDGSLLTPPTLRTALLDLIYRLDPATAASLSRQLLDSSNQPDEWALALRNVARHEDSPEALEYLTTKTQDLLTNPNWQDNPSVGFLESFDLLVHLKATQTTPLLSELIQKPDRPGLRHAAFLTLDRLARTDITAVLEHLVNEPALAKAYPKMIAQQFARADLKIPAQKALVDQWLRHPTRTELEIATFQASYPNNNSIQAPGLVTSK